MSETNPYAAPLAAVEEAPSGESELVAIRRAHVATEATLKSLGLLAVGAGAVAAITMLVTLSSAPAALLHKSGSAVLAGGGVFLLIAITLLATGSLLRRLQPRGRTLATAWAVVGIGAGVATGAPIISALFWGGLILPSLWSRKARMVFSEYYRTVVIPGAPRIRYRTRIWVWVLLTVFLILIGLLVFGRHR